MPAFQLVQLPLLGHEAQQLVERLGLPQLQIVTLDVGSFPLVFYGVLQPGEELLRDLLHLAQTLGIENAVDIYAVEFQKREHADDDDRDNDQKYDQDAFGVGVALGAALLCNFCSIVHDMTYSQTISFLPSVSN